MHCLDLVELGNVSRSKGTARQRVKIMMKNENCTADLQTRLILRRNRGFFSSRDFEILFPKRKNPIAITDSARLITAVKDTYGSLSPTLLNTR